MKLTLVRSATLRLEYAGRRLLLDPYLAPQHSRPSFTGKSPNPLVDLPWTPDEVIAGAEVVLVSHLHSDHFDPVAQQLVPKDLPLFCQPADEARVRDLGFRAVTAVQDAAEWNDVTITRTHCQHGSGSVLTEMGEASGWVLAAEGEPTVYWAGDTILTPDVLAVIERVQPDVIITHSSGAVWGERVLIVMDAAQTVQVCRAAPRATVIATHLNSLDHGTVTREDLRNYATQQGITPKQLLIPADGETLTLLRSAEDSPPAP